MGAIGSPGVSGNSVLEGQPMRRTLRSRATVKRGVEHLNTVDQVLRRIIGGVGPVRLEFGRDHFHALAVSIIFQQIAGRAAAAIYKRFLALFPSSTPDPETLLRMPDDAMREAGLSPQKTSYLKDLAARVVDGRLNFHGLVKLPDEEAIRVLDEVKGVGRWTAQMFLIFSLGRTDVLPVDDLGLRKAVREAYKLRSLPTREELQKIAEPWHPYCSLATIYLWRSGGTLVPARSKG